MTLGAKRHYNLFLLTLRKVKKFFDLKNFQLLFCIKEMLFPPDNNKKIRICKSKITLNFLLQVSQWGYSWHSGQDGFPGAGQPVQSGVHVWHSECLCFRFSSCPLQTQGAGLANKDSTLCVFFVSLTSCSTVTSWPGATLSRTKGWSRQHISWPRYQWAIRKITKLERSSLRNPVSFLPLSFFSCRSPLQIGHYLIAL